MKRWILLASAGLVVIGGIISNAALNFMDTESDNSEAQKDELKQWHFEKENTTSIFVNNKACLPLRIEASKDDKIHVLAYIYKQVEVTPELKDNRLEVYAEAKGEILSFMPTIHLKQDMPRGIEIQIPNGYTGGMELVNSNGSTTITEVSLTGDLVITGSNGSITFESVTVNNLTVANQNASVNLEELTVIGQLKVKNTNGSIKAETVSAKTVELGGENGRISLEEVRAAEELTAGNHNGAIKIEDIFSPNISLSNNNGSVKGNIEGKMTDYRIVSDIENGHSNLKDNADVGRPYLLDVRNKNGSVRIEFD